MVIHVKSRALGLTALVLLIMLSSAALQVAAAGLPAAEGGLETMARNMINVAAKAEARVDALIERVKGNETIMKAIIDAGLNSSLNEMIALKDHGSALLKEARELFENGSYVEASEKAIEAMRCFRDAYSGIFRILCQAGLTPLEPLEAPEVKAQGLLVAANRSLERIRRIRSLPNASDVEDLLSEAERLLGEVKVLLEQGNVSAAAHNLARANKLISEAFVRLRHRAEVMLQRRAEKFILGFGRIRNEFARRIREEGLNETEVLEDLDKTMQNLTETVRGAGKRIKDVIKDMIEDLRIVGRIFREMKKVIPERPPMEVKIGEILANPSAFDGKIVRVEGKYCGVEPPKNLQGPSGEPPEEPWWVLADETGWIYVVEKKLWALALMRRMPLLEGADVIVIGRVVVEDDGALYIESMLRAPRGPIILPVPPLKPIAPSGSLRLSAEVEKVGKEYSIKVTIENIGNETIIFPNSVYGIVIERKIAAIWVLVYTPIAAQVLTRLEPGETRTIVIPLELPSKPPYFGVYRVVASGWLEESGLPITASAEFKIP